MTKPLRRDSLIELFAPAADSPDESGSDSVTRILKAIRRHLDMDVAFSSEVANGEVAIRRLDAEAGGPIRIGQVFAAEESYCQRIIDGRLPNPIPDTAGNPEAAAAEPHPRCGGEPGGGGVGVHQSGAGRRPSQRADQAQGRADIRHLLLLQL